LQKSPSALYELATVLRASPESDALLILGRLLDSLPIGFHVTDCGATFTVVYANRVWERWLGPEKLPVAGKPLAELFQSAEAAGVLDIMRRVCLTARPEHLKHFEFRELGILQRGQRGETSRWDWEIYPLSGSTGQVTYLLNVIMDVSEPTPRRNRASAEDRQARNRRREAASGVLRIFGVAPEQVGRKQPEQLSEREHQVADLLALGFTNADIASRLNVSPATIASHVARILAKLGFRSRTQVAAWVVARRLADAGSSGATGSSVTGDAE
jgi:DNA-binding CsgD family transcriptional regulator